MLFGEGDIMSDPQNDPQREVRHGLTWAVLFVVCVLTLIGVML